MWVLVIMWYSLNENENTLQFQRFDTEAQCLSISAEIAEVAERETRVKTVCVGPEGSSSN